MMPEMRMVAKVCLLTPIYSMFGFLVTTICMRRRINRKKEKKLGAWRED